MAEKSSFVLYDKYHEQVSMLSDEQAGQLFKAVLAYRTGASMEINDPVVLVLLSVIKQQMDIDDQKYQETCDKRKAAGHRGGRPKKADGLQEKQSVAEEANDSSEKPEETNGYSENQEKAKKANGFFEKQNNPDSDNDCEYDCDYECDSDKDIKPIPPISPQGDSAPAAERKADAKEKPVRHQYGQYKNVLLSDDDMAKLQTEYPTDWQERVERLSEYMASTGKSYKSHLATIRAWARKDNERAPTTAKASTSGGPTAPKDDSIDDLLAKMTKWGWE